MKAVLMVGTSTHHFDVEAGEICSDCAGKIDAHGIPAGARSVSRKAICNLVSDLEAARADAGSDNGGMWLVPAGNKGRNGCSNHTSCGTTPSGMGNPHGAIADKRNGQAVGDRHGYRQSRIHGDESIGFVSDTGTFGLDNNRTMHLSNPSPFRSDTERAGDRSTCDVIDSGITISCRPKCDAGDTRSDHPRRKSGISTSKGSAPGSTSPDPSSGRSGLGAP